MGDRGQVYIKDEGVYLYTHWSASELVGTVHSALAKRWRWGDPEYLARIVFCEMVKGYEAGEIGFGIGTSEHGDVWRVVELDCEEQRIRVLDDDECVIDKTFEEFVQMDEISIDLLLTVERR